MRKGTLAILAALFLLMSLVGCSNPEAAVVGDWKEANGTGITTLKADHTVTETGKDVIEGKWSLDGKNVKIKVEKVGGKGVEEFKKQLEPFKAVAAANPEQKKNFDSLMSALDSGFVFTLGDDGKTMSTSAFGKTQTLTKVDKTS